MIETRVVDDFTREPADATLKFTVEGIDYEIDLTEENYNTFLTLVNPYVEAGRRVSGKRANPTRYAKVPEEPSGSDRRRELKKVREWANENGFEVSHLGRIPVEVQDAYDLANA